MPAEVCKTAICKKKALGKIEIITAMVDRDPYIVVDLDGCMSEAEHEMSTKVSEMVDRGLTQLIERVGEVILEENEP